MLRQTQGFCGMRSIPLYRYRALLHRCFTIHRASVMPMTFSVRVRLYCAWASALIVINFLRQSATTTHAMGPEVRSLTPPPFHLSVMRMSQKAERHQARLANPVGLAGLRLAF